MNIYKNVKLVAFSLFLFNFIKAGEIEYYWSGAVTSESAVISFATDKKAKIKIQYSDSKNFKKNKRYTNTTSVVEKSNFFAKNQLKNLKPNQIYYYRFNINGTLKKDQVGKFKTHSNKPFSYKVTMATCATTGSNSPVFDRIREENSQFYLMLGDFHYGNIYRDCEDNFLTYFRSTLGSKKQSSLYNNIPIAYMWDDHDYGPNNSAGLAPNGDGKVACQSEARHAYKNYVPHYPLAFQEEGKVISQVFNVGRITYLLTDLRSEKRRPLFQGDCENPDSPNCKKIKDG
jgi:alkaline phosphatase D